MWSDKIQAQLQNFTSPADYISDKTHQIELSQLFTGFKQSNISDQIPKENICYFIRNLLIYNPIYYDSRNVFLFEFLMCLINTFLIMSVSEPCKLNYDKSICVHASQQKLIADNHSKKSTQGSYIQKDCEEQSLMAECQIEVNRQRYKINLRSIEEFNQSIEEIFRWHPQKKHISLPLKLVILQKFSRGRKEMKQFLGKIVDQYTQIRIKEKFPEFN